MCRSRSGSPPRRPHSPDRYRNSSRDRVKDERMDRLHWEDRDREMKMSQQGYSQQFIEQKQTGGYVIGGGADRLKRGEQQKSPPEDPLQTTVPCSVTNIVESPASPKEQWYQRAKDLFEFPSWHGALYWGGWRQISYGGTEFFTSCKMPLHKFFSRAHWNKLIRLATWFPFFSRNEGSKKNTGMYKTDYFTISFTDSKPPLRFRIQYSVHHHCWFCSVLLHTTKVTIKSSAILPEMKIRPCRWFCREWKDISNE